MRILVCGDSFCANKKNSESWVHKLSSLLNTEVTTVGVNGCSNYFILQQYKNNFESYDIVIVHKTVISRIPVVSNLPHLSTYKGNSVSKSFPLRPNDYDQACEFYFKYYYDKDYLKWLNEHCINDISKLRPTDQKLIWINSAENNIVHHDLTNSIAIEGTLFSIYEKEILSAGYKSCEEYYRTNPTEKGKINHLSPENNYNLAVFLKNVILDPNANKDLSKHNWKYT